MLISPLRFIWGEKARTYFPQSSNSNGKSTYRDNNNNVEKVSHLRDAVGEKTILLAVDRLHEAVDHDIEQYPSMCSKHTIQEMSCTGNPQQAHEMSLGHSMSMNFLNGCATVIGCKNAHTFCTTL